MLFSHCLCQFDGSPVFQAKKSLLFSILSRHTALSFSRKIITALDFQSKPWYNNHVSNRVIKVSEGYASGTFLGSIINVGVPTDRARKKQKKEEHI